MATFAVAELTPNELAAYKRGANRAQIAYKRKHGTTAVPVPDGYRVGGDGAAPWEWRDDAARLEVAGEVAARDAAWKQTHGDSYAAAMHRGGVSAVRRMLKRYAEDERHAAMALERLEVLGLSGRTSTRKPAAPKPVPAPAPVPVVESPAAVAEPETVAEPADPVAPVVPIRAELEPVPAVAAPAVPETVPAPMPTMTRAARKASNRELAERMRAAGLTPSGDAWRLAQSGVPLEDLAAALSALTPANV